MFESRFQQNQAISDRLGVFGQERTLLRGH
jgi:hypothetical protein